MNDSQILIQAGYQSFGLVGAAYACFCIMFPFLYCLFNSRLFLIPYVISRYCYSLVVMKFQFICVGIWINRRLFVAPKNSRFTFKHWRVDWTTMIFHNTSCFDLDECIPFAIFKFKTYFKNIYDEQKMENDYRIAFRRHYMRNDYHFQHHDPNWNHHIKKEQTPRKMKIQSILELVIHWIIIEKQKGKWIESEKQTQFQHKHLSILNFSQIPPNNDHDHNHTIQLHPVSEQLILAILVLLKVVSHESFDWNQAEVIIQDDLEKELFKELKIYYWFLTQES